MFGLNAAGTAMGGSAALSAASAGVVGAKGTVDKNLFYHKTLPAILAQMEARHTAARVPIEQGLSKSDTEYALHKALADLSAYDRAGSIPGAISAIVQDAGANEYPDLICSGRVNQNVPFGQKRIADSIGFRGS